MTRGSWLPVLLAGVLAASGVTAWRLEAAAEAPPSRAAATTARTPVLSVRRVPEVLVHPIAARRFHADLAALTAYLPADSCLVVVGPDGLRYDWRGSVPLVPASTEKIVTATAVLRTLPADLRFRTTALGLAPIDGVVQGDLALVGGGDPLLATAEYASRFRRQPQTFTNLDELAIAVFDAGVRRVEGSVVGDERRYDDLRYVPQWPARYLPQNVIGPLSALSVNDGFASFPSPFRSAPLRASTAPAVDAAAVFTALLQARGIAVTGDPRRGGAPAGAVELGAIESAPLTTVVAEMLQESDNNTAELLLKELGRSVGSGSTASGVDVVLDVVDELADAPGTTLVDGSGLAPDDHLTCSALVDLLRAPDTGPVVVERLAVAGRVGTLAERFVGSPLAEVLRAKTGSLTSVSALAGVVADDDPALTFAVLVNIVPPAAVPRGVAELQGQIAEVLRTWPRTPDAADLGPVRSDG